MQIQNAYLKKINNDKPSDEQSYQIGEKVHVASTYALYLLRTYDEILITHYRGVNCIEKFVHAFKIMTMAIANTKKAKEKPLTNNEKYSQNRSNKCHICNDVFDENTNDSKLFKAKDFCYYTGYFRGAAHSRCS